MGSSLSPRESESYDALNSATPITYTLRIASAIERCCARVMQKSSRRWKLRGYIFQFYSGSMLLFGWRLTGRVACPHLAFRNPHLRNVYDVAQRLFGFFGKAFILRCGAAIRRAFCLIVVCRHISAVHATIKAFLPHQPSVPL